MVSIEFRSRIVLSIDHQCIGCNFGTDHTGEGIGQQRPILTAGTEG